MKSFKLAILITFLISTVSLAQENNNGKFFPIFRAEIEKKCPAQGKTTLQQFNCAYSDREEFNKFQNEVATKLCQKPTGNELGKCKTYIRNEAEKFAYGQILELDKQRLKEKPYTFSANEVKEICANKNIRKMPFTPNSDVECAKFLSEIKLDSTTVEYCKKDLVCIYSFSNYFVSLNYFGSKSKTSEQCMIELKNFPFATACFFGANEYNQEAVALERKGLNENSNLVDLYKAFNRAVNGEKPRVATEGPKRKIGDCKYNTNPKEQIVCPEGIYVFVKDSQKEAEEIIETKRAKILPPQQNSTSPQEVQAQKQ